MSEKSRAYKAAVGSILAVVLAIGSYGTVPLFLVPLSQSLGVSIGQVSLLFTFAASAGLVASLFFGTILKKLGVKRLACLTGAALATFYVFLFLAKNTVMVYIGAMIYGFSTSTGGYALAQTEITWWFSKGRAKVMSLLNIGVGLVGMVLAPVIASALEALGMRSVALIQGLLTGGLMIVNGLIFLSEHPSAYGLHPLGYVPEEAPAAAAETVQKAQKLTLKQMVTSAPFWLIFLACVLISAASTGFTNNASAFYQSIGLTAVQASFCISLYNAVKLGWSPVFGTLTDKKGPGFATLICGALCAATLFAGPMLTGYAGAITIAVMIGAISFSGMLGALCYPRVFGTKEAANLVGFASAAGSVGAMIGAPIAGFIYDATSSYSTYLAVAAGMIVVGIVFTMLGTSKKYIAKYAGAE